MNRRKFLSATSSTLAALLTSLTSCTPPRNNIQLLNAPNPPPLNQEFQTLESQSAARLGIAALDTQTNWQTHHRPDERFPMCSTFKFLAVASTLARIDAGKDNLNRSLPIVPTDILSYAPTTKQHVGNSMTLAALCQAAITLSDNTAANLLLRNLGGPPALTTYLRSIGDHQTRLDRTEPHLNDSTPGDPRDTTTPAAMLATMQKFLLGTILSLASRNLLTQWLINCQTGSARIRAGLPQDWPVGDKTGTGDHGTANDIAILFPPNRQPILMCVFLTQSPQPPADQNATIASVARSIATVLA